MGGLFSGVGVGGEVWNREGRAFAGGLGEVGN